MMNAAILTQKRMEQLEAIAKWVAMADPDIGEYIPDCAYCHTTMEYGIDLIHKPDCIWLLARKLYPA